MFDWYNFGRYPIVSVWEGCLSGCEPKVLIEHAPKMIAAFAEEYSKYGGPRVDPKELLLMYQLTTVNGLMGSTSFIESEIYAYGPSIDEWKEIESVWDPRIMNVWSVRCRVIALVQTLRYWHEGGIYDIVKQWIQSQRPGIDNVQ